jgi:hypothetical protein
MNNNIVFVVEIPLTEKNNVVTYNVSKDAGLKVKDVTNQLREAVEAAFPGIEGVQVRCRQNPDWHEIMRQREASKNRSGFFQRVFGRA